MNKNMLGASVVHNITGAEGTVIGVANYLNASSQALVCFKDESSKLPVNHWIEVEQLTVSIEEN